jgi:hypothetical protein
MPKMQLISPSLTLAVNGNRPIEVQSKNTLVFTKPEGDNTILIRGLLTLKEITLTPGKP